jgi:hypothetical protein
VIVGLGVRERGDGAESLHEPLRVDFLGRRVIAVQANQHLQRFPLHIVSRIGSQNASLQASSRASFTISHAFSTSLLEAW